MVDQQIQLPPDSTGKKLRTIELTTLINGVPTTVEMEVLSISDGSGNVINEFQEYEWHKAVLNELRRIRDGITQLLMEFGAMRVPTDPAPQDQGIGDEDEVLEVPL